MKKIIVEHLKYRYPAAKNLALDDLSFEVDEGEMVGIIGRNGAGKSTLCQALVGLVPHFYRGAYGGKVTVAGLEVMRSSVSRLSTKVGIVFQNPFTQVTGSKWTVYEEVAFGLENMGVPRKEMIERVDYALHLLGLEDCKDRNPFDLSGGQTQRLAIAGVIALKPEIIVLDEPTSQLDPQGTEEVFRSIHRLSEEGMTVVLVEHKMEKIARYCNRVMLLDEGKLIQFASPASVFSREDLTRYGVAPPVYTRVCRELDAKREGSPHFPVTLEEACEVLKGR
jgi:energy-coupling factor transport system ATP-binding protein